MASGALILMLTVVVLLMCAKKRMPEMAPSEEYKQFPWPPPEASAFTVISPGLLIKSAEKGIRLSHIERRLKAALDSCGYSQVSYFAVPDGFAMVTRLEQINPDGTPKDGSARWTAETTATEGFSLRNYFRALFSANTGFFRIIVFIATLHPFSQDTVKVTKAEAVEWLHEGYNTLPPGIGEMEYTKEYACTALIYEFEHLDTQKEAELRLPGLEAKTHLEKSGILFALRSQ
jgi:hypothetical protein